LKKHLLHVLAAALALAFSTGSGAAVDYPTQVVRIISPFSPGGGNDLMARELARRFSEQWDKTVIVEDKPGGNGDIGTNYVADSAPDGNTLLVTTNATIVINPQMFKKAVRFDPQTGFAPVSLLAKQPFILVVNPKLPIHSVPELIAYARAHPGELNFGSSGSGGGAHLAGEMLKSMLGLKMTHVPYKGVAPALTDVMAGHIDFMFGSILASQPLVRDGRLRAIAVSSKERNPTMPDLPSVSEFPGLASFESDLWYGLLAPAKTDPAIIDKINQAAVKALNDPQLKDRFEKEGTVLVGSTPAEFKALIAKDLSKWGAVIKAANLVSN